MGPRPTLAEDGHVVQIYREERELHEVVADWVARALDAHGAAILVGRPRSLAGIRGSLAAEGFDVGGLERAGRIVCVDAEGLMSRFMRDGWPEEGAFSRLVAAFGRAARRPAPTAPLRAWGEMVDILHARGDAPAARALEEQWGRAIGRQGIQLLCSYRLDDLDPHTHEGALAGVLHGHTRLIVDADEGRFAAAVEEALDAWVGPAQTARLWDRFGSGLPGEPAMPAAHAVLAGLHRLDPMLATKVLHEVRERIASRRSDDAV